MHHFHVLRSLIRIVDSLNTFQCIPYSSIPKTKFTCQNRGSGYYADVETGCQVYHMCDQQGKQFDYVCPNATLFQQRMLVCDHWYMVNCSKAESNYKYNSLIGQRNTPFVSESEHEQRTPRPDLIDRPYAPDYDGASFKKQLDKVRLSNAISGIVSKNLNKNFNKNDEILETQASNNIPPRPYVSNALDSTSIPFSEDLFLTEKTNERRNAFSEESLESVGRNMRPPPTVFEPPRLLPNSNQQYRQQEEARLSQLGLSAKPSTQFVAQPARATPVATNFQPGKQSVVRTFDPDKNFKAFENYFNTNGKKATHKDYDFSRYFTKKEAPRVQNNFNQKQQNNFQQNQYQRAPVTQPPSAQNGFNQKKSVAIPSREVLPPREGNVKSYDDSSTQGPPIYYEWKIPASALLPPLFGNETKEPTVSKQIKRTINGEGNFDNSNDFTSNESRRIKAGTKIQDKDLQRIFSVPQFDFPIENTGRDGYENLEALNSFQVKIPIRRDGVQQQSGAQQRYYYLENEHCDPSCHPSFFKPGRCEPCVKL
ncbi:unnamed protein product [Diamesa tonsa]